MTANTSAQIYDRHIRQVAGCIPVSASGTHVLLISSRAHPDEWIFPKGGHEVKDGPDPQAAAVRETWEEAGVRGTVTAQLAKMDRTPKDKPKKQQCVWWYQLRVDKEETSWPEMHIRRRKWFTMEQARLHLGKKYMSEALQGSPAYVAAVTSRTAPAQFESAIDFFA
ncbi:hypothetical protein RI367_005322 [Sorochytrium milnesiophthora]